MCKKLIKVPEFDGVSKECKDLISKMISPIQKRIPASEVLKHVWVTSDSTLNMPLSVNFNSLNMFTAFNKLKKVTLTMMASQLSEAEI
jgi:calcium-dependent protein kinase